MKFRWVVVFVMAMPLSSFSATGLYRGMDFFQARQKIINQGWVPYKTHHDFVKEGEDGFPYSGIERRLINRGVVEISGCSLGKTSCVFYYSKAGKCFLLETDGENVSQLKLFYWGMRSCPELE